jgi:pseudouridine kinase
MQRQLCEDRFGNWRNAFALFVAWRRLEAGMNSRPKLLAIGGAHIDRRGQLTVPYVPGASNPGRMREEVGGGVFNAARNAAQLGVDVAFLSVRGGDVEGDLVERAIAAAGFEDLSSVFLDRQTASYTAILDQNGDVITALADMDIYETALPRIITRRKTRDAIAAADAILTDANMPEAAIRTLLSLTGDKPVYAIAISPAKVVRLEGQLRQLHCLFLNMREAMALTGAEAADKLDARALIAHLQDKGLRSCVLTDGPAPVHFVEDGRVVSLIPPPVTRVVDATGAGDALAGICIALVMLQLSFTSAIATGLKVAAATAENISSVVRSDVNVKLLQRMDNVVHSKGRQRDAR